MVADDFENSIYVSSSNTTNNVDVESPGADMCRPLLFSDPNNDDPNNVPDLSIIFDIYQW